MQCGNAGSGLTDTLGRQYHKKWYDGETSSNIKCFGCSECGYIELYAAHPKIFEDGSKVKDR